MRGDQKRKAAHRHAVAEHEQSLASYQHRVAKLTAENRDLRERLAAQERTARQTERLLRAERDEGVAPQVEVLRLKLAAERQAHERYQRRIGAVMGKFMAHPVFNQDLFPARVWLELHGALGDLAGAEYDKTVRGGRAFRRGGIELRRMAREMEQDGTVPVKMQHRIEI